MIIMSAEKSNKRSINAHVNAGSDAKKPSLLRSLAIEQVPKPPTDLGSALYRNNIKCDVLVSIMWRSLYLFLSG